LKKCQNKNSKILGKLLGEKNVKNLMMKKIFPIDFGLQKKDETNGNRQKFK